MEAASTAGAIPRKTTEWHSINWKKAHRNVRRLQTRIVKASEANKKCKVRALQFILTRSFSGKAVAVRRVTSNDGKSTPGVDRVVWNTPEKKARAVDDLHHKGYNPLPLKRVAIPKSDGSPRFLGIPAMKDRAMQALHLLALDPVGETKADPNSYAYRIGRSQADAIQQCFIVLANHNSAPWILETDIEACFDALSHCWMLANIPMDKTVLSKWLRAGYIEDGLFKASDKGIAQGAIISPLLCNMALDGLERAIKEKFAPNRKMERLNLVNVVRYADDLIISGRTKELLEGEVRAFLEQYLKERGLGLKASKTRVVHISEGFDFLGQTIRKYDGKMLIKPSARNVKRLIEKTQKVIESNKGASAGKLIVELNLITKGWANYHRHSVSKETFSKVDWHIQNRLWRWARRRHRNKSAGWVKKNYFTRTSGGKTVFKGRYRNQKGEAVEVGLYEAAETAIKRHIKIKGEANPYDPEYELYFEQRRWRKMLEQYEGKKKIVHLLKEQSGRCVVCNRELTGDEEMNIHHIRWRVNGGGEEMANLVLLHANCHRQVHSKGLEVAKSRPVKRALEVA